MGTSEGARKGHTPESDAKRREAMRRKWADPEYRAKRAALEQTPEMKAARSNAMRVTNNDPEKRAHHSAVMKKKFASDEEYREKHAEGLRKSWQNTANAELRAEIMRQAWIDNPDAFEGSLQALRDEARSETGRERRRNLSALRAATNPVTPHEHAVALVLNELELPYFLHKVLEGKEMDIYIPSHCLDIEIDGSNHTGKGREQDTARDAYLKARGYDVLRLRHGMIDNGSFISKLQDILKLHAAWPHQSQGK